MTRLFLYLLLSLSQFIPPVLHWHLICRNSILSAIVTPLGKGMLNWSQPENEPTSNKIIKTSVSCHDASAVGFHNRLFKDSVHMMRCGLLHIQPFSKHSVLIVLKATQLLSLLTWVAEQLGKSSSPSKCNSANLEVHHHTLWHDTQSMIVINDLISEGLLLNCLHSFKIKVIEWKTPIKYTT